MKQTTDYRYRHLARLTVEAATPLAIGSGGHDIETDSPVLTDINGLPYIPGTSLAGVVRHALQGSGEEAIFGYQDRQGGHGSNIIFTDAVMVGKDGQPIDGAQPIDWDDAFYHLFEALPIRQHVRLTGQGTAAHGGKFDNQVVYKGVRFVFEVELVSASAEEPLFQSALAKLHDDSLRIGGGTRKGYGRLTVTDCLTATIDLSDPADLKAYLGKSSCLASSWGRYEAWKPSAEADQRWERYTLKLRPADFFLFGSGLGDDDADHTPASETVVTWSNGRPTPSQRRTLVPASSVKGALAHRTAYHYNRLKGYFAGDERAKEGEANEAVLTLFGAAGTGKSGEGARRGCVVLGDVYGGDAATAKTFAHAKIDQFTGGTIDGALFQEKAIDGRGEQYALDILVERKALADEDIRRAFEQSLADVCNGLLPLGGATNRGHGVFTGETIKH